MKKTFEYYLEAAQSIDEAIKSEENLIEAAANNLFSVAKNLLIHKKVDVNHVQKGYNRTALGMAVRYKNKKMALLLLKYKADLIDVKKSDLEKIGITNKDLMDIEREDILI